MPATKKPLTGTALRRSVPKEMFPVVKDAMDDGWVPYVDGKGHLRLEHPEYGIVSNGLTPTSPANEAKNLASDIVKATLAHLDRKTAVATAREVDKRRQARGETHPVPCWACQQENVEKVRTFTSTEGVLAHIRRDHIDILTGDIEEKEPDLATLEQQVREAMETFQGEALTTDDLIRLTDLDRKQIQNTLVRLIDDPDIPVKRKKRGVYIYQPKQQPKMKPTTKEQPVPETATAEKPSVDTPPPGEPAGPTMDTRTDPTEAYTHPINTPKWQVVMEGKDGSLMLKAEDGTFWKAERV